MQENLPAEVRAQALRAAALAAKLTAEAEARSAGTVTHLGGGIRCARDRSRGGLSHMCQLSRCIARERG